VTTAFYLPDTDVDRLRAFDPDRDWKLMVRGQRWVLQTFLRLREAGMDVELVGEVPRSGVLVFHACEKRVLRERLPRGARLTLVGIRADARPITIADVELLQNRRFAYGSRRVFVPYWPQPGLVPRDPRRGARVERIAFKGFEENLHPDFLAPAWSSWLEEHGMRWVLHSTRFRGSSAGVGVDWHDYHDVDVVVALRPDPESPQHRKPASKLCNAWQAGVPALLGPEHAYRELRRSELDYTEIRSSEDAKRALERLRAEPQLHQAIVANGRRRGEALTVERIVEAWRELLEVVVPSLGPPGRRPPYWLRSATRRIGALVHAQA